MPGNVEQGITLVFKGDSVQFDKSVDGVNRGLKLMQSELKDINKQLKLDPSNVELLKKKFENLSKQQELVQAKVEEYQKEIDSLDEKEIGSAKWVKLQTQLEKAQAQLKGITDQVDKFARANLDLVGLGEKFKQAGDKAEKFGNQLKGVSAAGLAVASSIGAMTIAAGKAADDINTLAKQYDLTTDQIQKFQLAAELIDVDFSTITKSYSKLTKNMTSSSSDVQEAFNKLDIQVRDSNGELRNVNDVFNETIIALSKIENETEQDSVAMSIFGKSAAELGPLIHGGTEQLAEFSKYLEENSLLLSQDELDALNDANDAIDKIKATLTAFTRKMATSFAPMVQKAFEKVNSVVLKLKNIWDGLNPSIQKLIPIVASLVGALAPALLAFSKISTAVGNLITKIGWNGGLGSTLSNLMNPIGLVITALGAMYASSEKFRDATNKLIGSLVESLSPILSQIVEILEILFNSLSAMLFPILTSIGDWFGTYILPQLQALTETVLPILSGILDILIGVLQTIVSWIGELWKFLEDTGTIEAIGNVFEWLGGIIEGLVGWIQNAVNWFGGLIDRAKEFLGINGQIAGSISGSGALGKLSRSGGFQSGAFGSGGNMNVTINVSNNGRDITPRDVRVWVDLINEELGGLVW